MSKNLNSYLVKNQSNLVKSPTSPHNIYKNIIVLNRITHGGIVIIPFLLNSEQPSQKLTVRSMIPSCLPTLHTPVPFSKHPPRPSKKHSANSPNACESTHSPDCTLGLNCKIFWKQTFASFLERNFSLEFAEFGGIWRIRQITAEICRICQICPATLKIKLSCNF